MKHKITLFLETDTIDWFKTVAANLSRQRNREVTLSETVDYVSQSHWRKTVRRIMDERDAQRMDRLKGTKLLKGVTTP